MSSRNARLFAVSACLLWMALAPVTVTAAPQVSGLDASSWLERLWGKLTSLWMMDGCQILPDGRVYCPVQPPPAPAPKNGEHEPATKAAPSCVAPSALQARPTPGRR